MGKQLYAQPHSSDQSHRVVAEVRRVIADCAFQAHPLACLNEHYRRLQADPTWSPDDEVAVYQLAVAILKAQIRDELRE